MTATIDLRVKCFDPRSIQVNASTVRDAGIKVGADLNRGRVVFGNYPQTDRRSMNIASAHKSLAMHAGYATLPLNAELTNQNSALHVQVPAILEKLSLQMRYLAPVCQDPDAQPCRYVG